MEQNKTMKTLAEQRLEFLDETVKHFNLYNRGINGIGACKFSKGCAIGRHLSKELAEELDKGGNDWSYIFSRLPLSLQVLGEDFLKSIIFLHDNPEYWYKKGLSTKGKEEYNEIRKMFNF